MNKLSQQDRDKNRLKKILAKKIETTMIFPLSEFEREFGHLWGQGKDEDKLTSEEKEFKEKWDKCRNNILNVGNRQRRNMFSELNMHEITWNKYQTTFLPIDKFNI